MRPFPAIRLCLLALMFFCAASLHAQGTPAEAAPEDATEEQPGAQGAEAMALIEAGVALRVEGREAEALEAFQKAYAIEPSPRAVAQMGLAEKSLRRYVDAEKHLAEALAAADNPWVTENRQALEAANDFVAKQLAWLVVNADLSGATLAVNGAELGAADATAHRVVAGELLVEIRAVGFVPVRKEVAVPAEVTTEIAVTLEAEAPAPVPKAEPDPVPVPTPGLPKEEPISWTPFIVGSAALAAVGVGVGIGLGVRALDLQSELDDVCPDPQCPTQAGVDIQTEGRNMALGSTISFVVGGLAGGAALLLWILEPDPSDDDTVSVGLHGVAVRF